MNIILIEQTDFTRDKTTAVIRGLRFQHIRSVLKSKVGDSLQIGELNGLLGTGSIKKITSSQVELEVDFNSAPPPPMPLILILALPRPIVLKRILQTITTLGIKEVYLIQTKRVEKSYWQSPVLQPDQIDKTLKEGLEQAKDTVLPNVYFKKRFKPFVEDELKSISKNTVRLVAHPSAQNMAESVNKPTTLVIGPEGGFIPYEIELLQSQNFSAIQLGVRILKVETAVTALISKLGL